MEFSDIRTAYQCELTTVSPVHTGSGDKYLKNFDFLHEDRMIKVFDRNKLFSIVEKGGEKLINSYTVAIEDGLIPAWFKENKINVNEILVHSFQAERAPRDISIQLRDGTGHPMIAGSSLKGAIRTAILARLVKEDGTNPIKNAVNRHLNSNGKINFKFADQQITNNLLGKDAKLNLMRGLTVGDFHYEQGNLELQQIWITRLTSPDNFTGKFPVTIEQLKSSSMTTGLISFDDFLGTKATEGGEAHSYFNFPVKLDKEWVMQAILDKTRKTIDSELEFLNGKRGNSINELREFYNDLRKQVDGLKDDEVILQLGWGSGWRGMTGQLLEPENLTRNLRKKLKLAPDDKYLGFPFPKSRKTVNLDGSVMSMGWVKLKFTPVAVIKEQQREAALKLEAEKNEADRLKNEKDDWDKLPQEEKDLSCVLQTETALKFALPDSKNPGQTIWKRFLDMDDGDAKEKLAQVFMDRWKAENKWKKKQCSKKQMEKVREIKKILEEG